MSIWDRMFGNDELSKQLQQLVDEIEEKRTNAENKFSGSYNTIYHHYTVIMLIILSMNTFFYLFSNYILAFLGST